MIVRAAECFWCGRRVYQYEPDGAWKYRDLAWCQPAPEPHHHEPSPVEMRAPTRKEH